jgi:hypothetical protein
MGNLLVVLVLGFGVLTDPARASAQTCRKGCACGNSCISCAKTCHKDPGTAHREPDPAPPPKQAPKPAERSHDARVEFVSTIGPRLNRQKIAVTFRLGDPDTSLLVTSNCMKGVVERVRDLIRDDAKAVGFIRLWCEDKSAGADF